MLISLGCDLSMIAALNWETRYEQLREFKEKHGRFPTNADVKNDELCRVLCTWINTQRGRFLSGKITEEQKVRLNAIGFPWSRQDTLWDKNFELVCSYYSEHHTVPEIKVRVDGFNIGVWFSKQIGMFVNGTLPPERTERFQSAGIPLRSPREMHKPETWMKYYNSYLEYLTRYGRQPGSTERYNDLELRKWRSLQLKLLRQGKLTDDQAAKLEELCGDEARPE